MSLWLESNSSWFKTSHSPPPLLLLKAFAHVALVEIATRLYPKPQPVPPGHRDAFPPPTRWGASTKGSCVGQREERGTSESNLDFSHCQLCDLGQVTASPSFSYPTHRYGSGGPHFMGKWNHNMPSECCISSDPSCMVGKMHLHVPFRKKKNAIN